MNKILAAMTLAFIAAPAVAADAPATPVTSVVATPGKMLLAAGGARLAPIYAVSNDGAQIILDGRMVTVPSNTIAMNDGKLTTSLTKSQVSNLR